MNHQTSFKCSVKTLELYLNLSKYRSKIHLHMSKICRMCMIYNLSAETCILSLETQGCCKLFRAGGANRAKRASRANRRQWGLIVQKKYFVMFCYYNFLLVLAQSKHQKFRALLTPWARGGRGSRLLQPRCPAI